MQYKFILILLTKKKGHEKDFYTLAFMIYVFTAYCIYNNSQKQSVTSSSNMNLEILMEQENTPSPVDCAVGTPILCFNTICRYIWREN